MLQKTDYGGVFFFPFVYLSVLLLPPFQWFYGPFGSGIGSPKQRYRNIFTYVLANVTGRNLSESWTIPNAFRNSLGSS